MKKIRTLTMQAYHLTDMEVAVYVDALKLNTVDQLPIAVREHVSKCFDCKANVTELFALIDGMDYSHLPSHPSFRIDKRNLGRNTMVLRLAAVIAGAAIVSTITYYAVSLRHIQGVNDTAQKAVEQGIDSVAQWHQKPSGSDAIANRDVAANSSVDPELEQLVNGQYRSDAITVLMPANGSVEDSVVVFSWKGGEKERLILRVLNNSGQSIFNEVGAKSPYTLEKRLIPGLYYWKIESEAELLYVGKFVVD